MKNIFQKIYQSKKTTVLILIGGLVLVLAGGIVFSGFWGNRQKVIETGDNVSVIKVWPAGEALAMEIDLPRQELKEPGEILEQAEITIIKPDQAWADQAEFDLGLAPQGSGSYSLTMKPRANNFQPGKYHISLSLPTSQGYRNFEQDFYWGVLAMNFNQATFAPGDRGYIQMGVLDDKGDTICDAALELRITNNELSIDKILSTADGSIVRNPKCGPNNVIDEPDYYADFDFLGEGIYQMILTAETKNGRRQISDYAEVKKNQPFSVERSGPTRIWPWAPYTMTIKIKANEDFRGQAVETVPPGFEIIRQGKIVTENLGEGKFTDRYETAGNRQGDQLKWDLDLDAGEAVSLVYTFDAPDVSPEFYLLGPVKIIKDLGIKNYDLRTDQSGTENGEIVFVEARQWQIAGDDVTGFTDPTSNGTGSNCTSSNNIYTSDNNFASCYDTQVVDGDTFNFSITNGNTIDGVEVRIEWRVVQIPGEPIPTYALTCQLLDASGALIGSSKSTDNNSSRTDHTDTLGGGSDKWDGTLTESIVEDADFGVRCTTTLISNGGGSPGPARIDNIDMQITHSTPAGNSAPTISSVDDSPDPVTIGQEIAFATTWSDAGDQVKVKICKTNALSGQNCTGGYWATSTAFTATTPTTTRYLIANGDEGTQSYYAFVCDDEAACSSSTSGSFVVAPRLVSVSDDPDPVGVGYPVLFSVDWNDGDSGEKIVTVICKGSGITTSTAVCKDGEWARSPVYTNRDPENLASYTTVEDDKGNTRNYWAFVCDDGNACSDGAAGTFTVANQRPDAPVSLLIEGMEIGNAMNVEDTTPEFSAVYKDYLDEGDLAVKYCLEVDTQSDFAGTEMWMSDSASCYTGSATAASVVESQRTENFSYAGTALSLNGATYYWRMWLWDGEERSATSTTGWFKMANSASGAGVRLQGGRLKGGVRLK